MLVVVGFSVIGSPAQRVPSFLPHHHRGLLPSSYPYLRRGNGSAPHRKMVKKNTLEMFWKHAEWMWKAQEAEVVERKGVKIWESRQFRFERGEFPDRRLSQSGTQRWGRNKWHWFVVQVRGKVVTGGEGNSLRWVQSSCDRVEKRRSSCSKQGFDPCKLISAKSFWFGFFILLFTRLSFPVSGSFCWTF